MSKMIDARVISKQQWTDRHFSLRIDAPKLDFRAGQFIRVGLEIEGELVARPYSLVNATDDPVLEIFFNIVPTGPLSPKLASLEPGDCIKVSDRANGFLVAEEIPDVSHLWLLATGTGVGPFISMLHNPLLWQKFERVVLVYSVRTEDELAYLDRIHAIEQTHEQFSFIPAVTREIVSGALTTRITSALQSGDLEERANLVMTAEQSHVMMCGNADMISAVMAELGKRGMKKHLRREPGHITTEKYH